MGLKTAKQRIQFAAYMRDRVGQKRKELARLLASGKPLPIKICKKCGQSKPISEFYVNVSFCIPCHNQRSIQWAKENPTRAALINLRFSRKHRTERYREAAKWKRLNPQRHAELNRRWNLRHPEACRILRKAGKALRRARAVLAKGYADSRQILDRVKMWGGLCWICGDPWQQIDHVKPLNKGGSNWPANLRPICGRCNNFKGAKWPLNPREAIY